MSSKVSVTAAPEFESPNNREYETPSKDANLPNMIESPDTEKKEELLALVTSNHPNTNFSEMLFDITEFSDELITQMLEAEFPTKQEMDLTKCISTCVSAEEDGANAGAAYSVGDWVEVCGPDMKWRLTFISRIIKQAPESFDWSDPDNKDVEPEWNFYYNAGTYMMLDVDAVRSPEEGLRAIYGSRPWLFQQWALLKFETVLRFQKDHPSDFEEISAMRFARDLW